MKKLIKKFLLAAMAILIIALCGGAGWMGYYADAIRQSRADKEPWPFYTTSSKGEHLIAHAGGEIDGHIYTDAKEAYEQSVKKGMKFIEVDLLETTDGDFVAAHDWELFNTSIGAAERQGAPRSLEEVQAAKIYGKYSTLDERQIAEFCANIRK